MCSNTYKIERKWTNDKCSLLKSLVIQQVVQTWKSLIMCWLLVVYTVNPIQTLNPFCKSDSIQGRQILFSCQISRKECGGVAMAQESVVVESVVYQLKGQWFDTQLLPACQRILGKVQVYVCEC